jgi:hypothetical protein
MKLQRHTSNINMFFDCNTTIDFLPSINGIYLQYSGSRYVTKTYYIRNEEQGYTYRRGRTKTTKTFYIT